MLKNRIMKLEKKVLPRKATFLWLEQGQSEEEAIARHLDNNPEDSNSEFFLLTWQIKMPTVL